MAQKVVQAQREGGAEGRLAGLGMFLLVFGMIALAGSVLLVVNHGGWLWLALGVNAMIGGIVMFVVLDAAAEALRVLKKGAGIQYGGQISKPAAQRVAICSACGRVPVKDASDYSPADLAKRIEQIESCERCGARFEP